MEEMLKNALSKIYAQNKMILEGIEEIKTELEAISSEYDETQDDTQEEDVLFTDETKEDQPTDVNDRILTKDQVTEIKEQEAIKQINKENASDGIFSTIGNALGMKKRGRPKKTETVEQTKAE